MTLVTVMRHSDRLDEDASAVIARIFDTPLSAKGINLAINTKIAGAKKTIASPFLRCVHTAVLSSGVHSFADGILSFTPTKVTIDNRLCEVWNRRVVKSPLEMVTLLSVEEYQDAIGLPAQLELSAHPLPPVEETRGTGGTADLRFKAAIRAIVSENADVDHILIVSHGDAIGAMANLVGLSIYEANFCSFITAKFNGSWSFVSSNGVGILSE